MIKDFNKQKLSWENFYHFTREKNILKDWFSIVWQIYPQKNSIEFKWKIKLFSPKYPNLKNFPLNIHSKIKFENSIDNQNISQPKYYVELSEILENTKK